ncbi:MAG: molybdenum cofactor biosynthesis protein MoaE [Gemmatimonadaceae bacterium]|nr:molybdenum cofactor biosynthesis protein MoaE [Gloeobacterales cyanobacterium ES-bin-141]
MLTQTRNDGDFAFTLSTIDIESILEGAQAPGQGAVVFMLGTVRDNTAGRAVAFLEYEAYEPMALRVFAQIADQIRARWPGTGKVAIHHRLGKLRIREVSVVVAVGQPHRAEAFAACQYAIDTLKHNAPIWKKEHWTDGASAWVSIGACDDQHGQ